MIKKIYPLNNAAYQMPTMVYYGRDSLFLLLDIIKEKKPQNILLVTGEHFKTTKEFRYLIEKVNNLTVYKPIIKKCNFETINKLIHFCRQNSIDAIISIGGGTVIDMAKCAAAVVVNGKYVEDYLVSGTKQIAKRGLFLVAVPTTSGTGSEVTPWATVWDRIKKYSLDSKYIFPDIAIVDPCLTYSLPKNHTAEPGIDALCQAIESYWNINSNLASDKYALESIGIILKKLSRVVNNPSPESRDCMAWGSLLGGLAFSNTRTTICHAVSYPMTIHWGVPHGQAAAITLPPFIEYTFPVLSKERLLKILDAMQVKSPKEAAEKVTRLMIDTGLKTRLSELGIPKRSISLIVKEGFDPSRAKNIPKVPSPEELECLLYGIL
ncbi:hypothetical protein A2688_03900 [Candidatus Daviesbacteria bacterium RIFCSPHIGHO2_01_FULL_38_8]|nr:MAG: hypothetical protein A2688_03900 [Candidatus Daviesbacteria bacterium RIFCSPHIGHO2_01_FULL_38_8]